MNADQTKEFLEKKIHPQGDCFYDTRTFFYPTLSAFIRFFCVPNAFFRINRQNQGNTLPGTGFMDHKKRTAPKKQEPPFPKGALLILHRFDHLEVNHGPVAKDDRNDRNQAGNSQR